MKIEITRAAHEDMRDAATYISQTLGNKSTALKLISETEEKISYLKNCTESIRKVRFRCSLFISCWCNP